MFDFLVPPTVTNLSGIVGYKSWNYNLIPIAHNCLPAGFVRGKQSVYYINVPRTQDDLTLKVSIDTIDDGQK